MRSWYVPHSTIAHLSIKKVKFNIRFSLKLRQLMFKFERYMNPEVIRTQSLNNAILIIVMLV